ncbi:hypothetical protein Phi4:1_gp121 [Cellulophaga phage phi4:1]|jgi:hypothetical protein|uniref:Uncharacterized protein n=5 Tax=Lightbulbvirus TaxID=1918522 RepID=A0A0S2MWN9_9CAUD|nr:hypothetical protein Phi4:1_gp121 [Cellulophaga phage phi4:1]YP_008241620.1 hypothetical protein Phi17:2_gp125 [Cellulophaga phage phi17:2]ALO80130.1 hypothetical protein Phi4113_121 [Cellulophaga phage phi4:1_13]ALO80327.1 hypothetical protein Phi4118_121 [Cellulophaga phage phi4:1_18]ALO80528.1 hypothetical protein Phi17218_125 [Cellulophaga phage phi17:2_18]AGO47658.1 hypothetical protein Phi17:2_gp125 [Cellulophaga phage phi17:2]AGO49534.1 hypothetical protein Phi4:1_gp121 [Cellulophag
MTLIGYLAETPIKELLRAVNSDKEYLFFDISVFNVGTAITVKCTDTYKEINRNTWNGYDFIIENNETTKNFIANSLFDRYKEDKKQFTPNQLARTIKAIKSHA